MSALSPGSRVWVESHGNYKGVSEAMETARSMAWEFWTAGETRVPGWLVTVA